MHPPAGLELVQDEDWESIICEGTGPDSVETDPSECSEALPKPVEVSSGDTCETVVGCGSVVREAEVG